MSRQYRVPNLKKVSGELFTLTYGAFVVQLLKDYEDDEEVNKQLEKMGFNIGCRIIEDFLAHTTTGRCQDFKETADVLANVGFKMFLGVVPTVTNWSADNKEFSLILDENPLTEFVELPDKHKNLLFSNILSGVIRGSLEMIQLKVESSFVKDALRGDDTTEIRVKLIQILQDEAPPGEE